MGSKTYFCVLSIRDDMTLSRIVNAFSNLMVINMQRVTLPNQIAYVHLIKQKMAYVQVKH